MYLSSTVTGFAAAFAGSIFLGAAFFCAAGTFICLKAAGEAPLSAPFNFKFSRECIRAFDCAASSSLAAALSSAVAELV